MYEYISKQNNENVTAKRAAGNTAHPAPTGKTAKAIPELSFHQMQIHFTPPAPCIPAPDSSVSPSPNTGAVIQRAPIDMNAIINLLKSSVSLPEIALLTGITFGAALLCCKFLCTCNKTDTDAEVNDEVRELAARQVHEHDTAAGQNAAALQMPDTGTGQKAADSQVPETAAGKKSPHKQSQSAVAKKRPPSKQTPPAAGTETLSKQPPSAAATTKQTRIRQAGDCLYDAVADALSNTAPDAVNDYRQETTKCILTLYQNNPNNPLFGGISIAELNELVLTASSSQMWNTNGGDRIPYFLAHALGIHLIIHVGNNTYDCNPGGSTRVELQLQGGHYMQVHAPADAGSSSSHASPAPADAGSSSSPANPALVTGSQPGLPQGILDSDLTDLEERISRLPEAKQGSLVQRLNALRQEKDTRNAHTLLKKLQRQLAVVEGNPTSQKPQTPPPAQPPSAQPDPIVLPTTLAELLGAPIENTFTTTCCYPNGIVQTFLHEQGLSTENLVISIGHQDGHAATTGHKKGNQDSETAGKQFVLIISERGPHPQHTRMYEIFRANHARGSNQKYAIIGGTSKISGLTTQTIVFDNSYLKIDSKGNMDKRNTYL